MARLDTGWHAHPKILALSVAGMAVHAWSISYCDDALTDGFIPMGAWPSKRGFNGGIKELVAAGLWLPVQGGYQLHDYTDYNRTRAQVDAYMAAKAAAGRAGGQASASARAQAKAQANGQQMLKQNSTPGPGSTSLAVLNAAAAAAELPVSSSNEPRDYPRARAHEDDPLGVLNQPSIGRRFDREQQQQQRSKNPSRYGGVAAC